MAIIEINKNPSTGQLRRFSIAWIVVLGVIGWLVLRRHGHLPLAVLIWTAAVVIGAIGVIAPRLVRPVWLALIYATFPIGFVVSHVVLAVVYYLILTPIGLVMRLAGRDPLRRTSDPTSGSYWVRRNPPTTTERYLRQF